MAEKVERAPSVYLITVRPQMDKYGNVFEIKPPNWRSRVQKYYVPLHVKQSRIPFQSFFVWAKPAACSFG